MKKAPKDPAKLAVFKAQAEAATANLTFVTKTQEEALKALEDTKGNIAEAIILLTAEKEE